MNRRELVKLMGAHAAAAGCLPLIPSSALASPLPHKDIDRTATDFKPTVSERIADFVLKARFEDLPASVVQKTKEQLAFFFGRALEGASLDEGRQMVQVLREFGTSGRASVIGHRLNLSPSDAAGANCSLMRGSTRDDVIWPAGIHAGVVAIPPALAVAGSQGATGRDLILSVALAYEVMGKLGRAAHGWSSRFPRRPTNIYGGFGPIVAAGRLLKLDRTRLEQALGYAPNIVIGIPEGGMMTHYYSLIAHSGTFAAHVAAAGGNAYSRETIEGAGGLYQSFFGHVPPELPDLVGRLGKDWEIMTAEQKRHHGTGQNTPAIELLLDLMNTEGLTAENMSAVDVVLDFDGAKARMNAVKSRGPFERAVDAYSSLPYAFALMLLYQGRVDAKWYADDAPPDLFNDPAVARIMQRVNLQFEKGHSPRYAKVIAGKSDGTVLNREADNLDVTLRMEDWDDWLLESGEKVIGRDETLRLASMLRRLEHVSADDLMTAASGATGI